MLLIDVMAGKTSDIIEALSALEKPRPRHIPKRRVWVRAYVVGAYERKKPNKRVVSIETLRRQRELTRRADKILASRA